MLVEREGNNFLLSTGVIMKINCLEKWMCLDTEV